MSRIFTILIIGFTMIFNSFCNAKALLDSRKIEQIAGLCKVWGFLKYYHPAIQRGRIDWDSTLVKFLPRIIDAQNGDQYNENINQLIKLPGRVKILAKPFKFLPDTTYNTLDFSWINNDLFTSENQELLSIVVQNYVPKNNNYIKKEINKYYFDRSSTYNQFLTDNNYNPDTLHCLTSLFRYWNAINYLYAYKNIMDENWDSVLIEFIPKIISDAGRPEFYLDLAEICSRINDCHGFFDNYNYLNEIGFFIIPLEVKFVDNKTIVTNISRSLSMDTKIKIGDVILEVNDENINQRRIKVKKYCGCSTAASVERNINTEVLRSKTKNFKLKFSDYNDNKVSEVEFSYDPKYWDMPENNVSVDSLNNVSYLALKGKKSGDIRNFFKRNSKDQAIIFDYRNNDNPFLFWEIGLRLPGFKKVSHDKYFLGNMKYPGTYKLINQKFSFYGLRIFHRKYRGIVIFLIDESVQSTYEWQLMVMKSNFNVTLIGENTAGTDGEAKSILVQKNFIAYFSADAVLSADGKQIQRVGLSPDIIEIPTLDGIRSGKDEVFEKAMEYIKKLDLKHTVKQ